LLSYPKTKEATQTLEQTIAEEPEKAEPAEVCEMVLSNRTTQRKTR
jgi:hypothetical protein